MPILASPVGAGVAVPTTVDTIDLAFTLAQGGSVLPLDGAWSVQAGASGLDDPVMAVDIVEAPGLHGGFANGAVVPAREVFLPLALHAASGTEWRAQREALRAVTNPLAGPTRLTVSRPDGSARWIDGYRVVDNSEAWSADTWSHAGWQRMGLILACPSPWWRESDAIHPEAWITGGTAGGFLGPQFLPVSLGASTIFGAATTLTVPGDAEAWPTWVITGTATAVTVTHDDTGRSWSLTGLGALDRPLTVVTDPLSAGVTDGAGANQWATLAAPFDLWPLPVGQQSVTVEVTGGDSTTSVQMTADSLHMAAL